MPPVPVYTTCDICELWVWRPTIGLERPNAVTWGVWQSHQPLIYIVKTWQNMHAMHAIFHDAGRFCVFHGNEKPLVQKNQFQGKKTASDGRKLSN